MKKPEIPLCSKISLIISAIVYIAYKVLKLLDGKGVAVYLGRFTHVFALSAVSAAILFFAGGIIVLLCKNLKKVPAFLMSAVIAAAAVGYSAMLFVFSESADYHEFITPDEKHEIVVCEKSFLLGGWGEIYEKTSPLTLKLLGEYTTDDGFMPFSSGNYRFEWRDNGFELFYDFGSGNIEKCVSAVYEE
ncbi:MAG: hypothetical protein MJ173_06155 [Clostridia bacterium]|nr:hypothetical protein [Clostridia bacterium]